MKKKKKFSQNAKGRIFVMTLAPSIRRLSRLGRFGLIAAACLSVAACPQDTLEHILVNETSRPIEVSYTLWHPDPRAYPANVCILPQHPNRLSRDQKAWTRDSGAHRPLVWQALPAERIDMETCTLTAELQPGDGLHVITDSPCADDVREARRTGGALLERTPDVVLLTIRGSDGPVTHQGWQVAEQFDRHESGHCLYRIKD